MMRPAVPGLSLHKVRKSLREAFLPASDRLGALALLLLLIFSAFSPFLPDLVALVAPSAPVEPTGTFLLELCAFGVAAATFFSKTRPKSLRPLAVPAAAMTAFVGFGIAQLLPLPEEVLRRVAPANLQIYHETAQILGVFGREAPHPRISIAPGESLRTLLQILAYAALFLSSAALLNTRPRRRLFLVVVVVASALRIALTAAGPQSAGVTLWLGNPGTLAAFLLIPLSLAFGVLWGEVLVGADRSPSSADKGDRFEMRFVPLAWRFMAWAAIAVGIGWTGSRVGILAAAITTLTLFALAVTHRRIGLRRRYTIGVTLAALAALLFAATAAGPFRSFLEAGPGELRTNWRLDLWRVSLQAFREFPLMGSGSGTFAEAFRRVQPRNIIGVVEHVHSDFLQLLVTTGTVGATLVLLLFASFFIQLFRAWREQRHRKESAIALAGLGCLLAIGLHGLLEFNFGVLVIPAGLACALGAAWAAATHRSDHS